MINDQDYEYDSLVGADFQNEIEYLPEEYTDAALSALNSIAGQGLETVFGAKIATVYDRNGYMNHDKVTGPKNPAYATDHDDIILQITIRVDGRQVESRGDGYIRIAEFIDRLKDDHREAEIKAVEKELASVEEAKARLEAAIQEKRDKLSELKNLS